MNKAKHRKARLDGIRKAERNRRLSVKNLITELHYFDGTIITRNDRQLR